MCTSRAEVALATLVALSLLCARPLGADENSAKENAANDGRREEDQVDITGIWKFSASDPSGAEKIDFDDSQWQTIPVPQRGGVYRSLRSQPIIWFRHTVQLPERLLGRPGSLSMSLGPLSGSAEIYVNGEQIGTRGMISPEPTDSQDYEWVRHIPRNLVPADGKLVLAIRAWQSERQRTPWSGNNQRLWPGLYIIGRNSTLLARAEEMRLRGHLPAIIGIVIGVSLVLVGFNYLSIYRKRREKKAFLYFSCMCFSIGSYAIFVNRIVSLETFHLSGALHHSLGSFLLALTSVTLIEFTQFFLFTLPPKPWLRRYQMLCLLCACIGLIPNRYCYLFGGYPAGSSYAMLGILLCVPALIRKLRLGSSEVRLLAFGYLFTLLSIGVSTIWALVSEGQPGSARVLSLFSPLVLTMVMAQCLSSQFVSSLNSLDATHRATRRFVPLEYLKLLGKSDLTEICLGDHVELTLSVLFFDIRDFTMLSERLGPQGSFAFINRLQDYIEPAIHGYRGVIGAHLGDGVMALFQLPADRVLAALIDILHAVQLFNRDRLSQGEEAVRVGIGVHTGVAVLGTVGTEPRQSVTLISDTVNLAARIEGMTKVYGVAALISESTVENLSDKASYSLRPVGRVVAKGKREPTDVYEVLDILPIETRNRREKTLEPFTNALERFRLGDFVGARELFDEVLAIDPSDGPAEMYLSYCAKYAASGPPSDWAGIVHLTEK